MISKPGDLWTLLVTFGLLSLFSIGGAVSAVPEMHRLAVDTYHWMTDQQFTDNFAIAMLSPGPNVIIVTLIGYHVAGIAGALIATFAMCGPAALVAGIVGRTFERSQDAEWAIIIKTALVPVSIGLMGAAAFILAITADTSWAAGLLTLGAAAVVLTTRINPIWILIAGGLAGLTGFI
jgi:chromate transporter